MKHSSIIQQVQTDGYTHQTSTVHVVHSICFGALSQRFVCRASLKRNQPTAQAKKSMKAIAQQCKMDEDTVEFLHRDSWLGSDGRCEGGWQQNSKQLTIQYHTYHKAI